MKKKRLPRSFSLVKRGKTTIYIKNTCKKWLLDKDIEKPDTLLKNNKSVFFYHGRDPVVSVPINNATSGRIVVKHYTHGGLTRIFNRDIFWGRIRPLKELFFIEKVILLNIPTYEVLAVIIHKMPGFFYRADLITREISNGVDLKTYLENLSNEQNRRIIKKKREVISSVADLIRKMHSAGIYHADLHLKNIIIQKNAGAAPSLYIIDFDNSIIKSELNFKQKINNIFRFHRYIDKLDKKKVHLTRTDFLRFFKHYLNNEKNIKQSVQKYLRGYAWHIKIHNMWRRLLEITKKPDKKTF